MGVSSLIERRRDDRGAAAVEAALILPVVFVMFFGIIDFAMLLRDDNTVGAATRNAGRVATTLPKEAMTVSEPRFNTSLTDNVNAAVMEGLRSLTAGLDGIPRTAIREAWFFQAASDGTPAGTTNIATNTCVTNCVRYTWDASLTWTDTSVSPSRSVLGGFRRVSGSWPATSINACQGQTHSIGVYLQVRRTPLFPWTRALTGGSVDLSETAVFRFEPRPVSRGLQCGATT